MQVKNVNTARYPPPPSYPHLMLVHVPIAPFTILLWNAQFVPISPVNSPLYHE